MTWIFGASPSNFTPLELFYWVSSWVPTTNVAFAPKKQTQTKDLVTIVVSLNSQRGIQMGRRCLNIHAVGALRLGPSSNAHRHPRQERVPRRIRSGNMLTAIDFFNVSNFTSLLEESVARLKTFGDHIYEALPVNPVRI